MLTLHIGVSKQSAPSRTGPAGFLFKTWSGWVVPLVLKQTTSRCKDKLSTYCTPFGLNSYHSELVWNKASCTIYVSSNLLKKRGVRSLAIPLSSISYTHTQRLERQESTSAKQPRGHNVVEMWYHPAYIGHAVFSSTVNLTRGTCRQPAVQPATASMSAIHTQKKGLRIFEKCVRRNRSCHDPQFVCCLAPYISGGVSASILSPRRLFNLALSLLEAVKTISSCSSGRVDVRSGPGGNPSAGETLCLIGYR